MLDELKKNRIQYKIAQQKDRYIYIWLKKQSTLVYTSIKSIKRGKMNRRQKKRKCAAKIRMYKKKGISYGARGSIYFKSKKEKIAIRRTN